MTIPILLIVLLLQAPSMRGDNETKKPTPSSSAPAERNETYRKRLLEMLEKDQELRTRVAEQFKDMKAGQPVPPTYRAELDKLTRNSNQIAAEMKSLINKHGWPGHRKVGRDATAAACLLVQNMDKQVTF